MDQMGPWCPLRVSVSVLVGILLPSFYPQLTNLASVVPAADACPGPRLFAHDNLTTLEVQTDACNAMLQFQALEFVHRLRASPKVDPLAGGHSQDRKAASNIAGRGVLGRQGDKLAGLDFAVEDLLTNDVTGGQVEPPEGVVGCSDDRVRILGPSNELDGASMGAFANFKASRGRHGDGRTGGRVGIGGEIAEVEDSKLLLHASCGDKLRVVRRVSDGADNVVVLKGVEDLSTVSVPDLAAGH